MNLTQLDAALRPPVAPHRRPAACRIRLHAWSTAYAITNRQPWTFWQTTCARCGAVRKKAL